MDLNLLKENIECEQLLGENFVNTPIKGEYVIPDTHPDVYEVLMLDAKPYITSKEVMQDKLYMEGYIDYNILYLAKEEERGVLYNTRYSSKFSNDMQITGTEKDMLCEAECFVEDMYCKIVNERKISIEGIVRLKGAVYKKYNFEIIKDLDALQDIQMLRNPISIDKIAGTATGELLVKTSIKIGADKPEVGSILKTNLNIHKKKITVLDDKVSVEAFAKIELIYRAKENRDICYIVDDIFIDKEVELEGVNSFMESYTDFTVDGINTEPKEDDLGESRIIDVEALVKSNTRVMYKKEIELIEDMYSPNMMLNMNKEDYELNVMQGHSKNECIVKENIEITSDMPSIRSIIMTEGKAYITDKKIVEDKVVVEGVLNAEVMYKTTEDEKYIYTLKEDMPFSCAVDIPGTKIDMQCMTKVVLEDIEANIEANTVAIKALIEVYSRVNYTSHKEFLVNVEPMEEEVPEKKSSITIYVVQQGDTLWKIAKRYYTTVDNLVLINEIDNPDVIKPGQKLIIPGKAII
ncbi:DUF3794 domain-containing protein [Clostridium botulinum]|nr:DUF3794 domain-containing protein [Clostridium botulinum]EKO2043539.1 DUF3794 domain-containing protein [Clostridium botulinum]